MFLTSIVHRFCSLRLPVWVQRDFRSEMTRSGEGPARFPVRNDPIHEPSEHAFGPLVGCDRWSPKVDLRDQDGRLHRFTDRQSSHREAVLRRSPERDDREPLLLVEELDVKLELSSRVLSGPRERPSTARSPRPPYPRLEPRRLVRRSEAVEHLTRRTTAQALMRPVVCKPLEIHRQLLLQCRSGEHRSHDARHLRFQRSEEPFHDRRGPYRFCGCVPSPDSPLPEEVQRDFQPKNARSASHPSGISDPLWAASTVTQGGSRRSEQTTPSIYRPAILSP
jgi:hypothetical protein